MILLGAEWCGPCKVVKGKLKEANVDYEYVDVDTDKGKALAGDWGVRSVPSAYIEGIVYTGDRKILEAILEQK